MPRDSSGNYTLPVGNPVIDGTVIDVNWANPTMNDIAVQLNNVITRDGLLGPTLPMYFVDGTPALPGIAFNAQHGTGFWRDSAQIGVSYAGVAKQTWGAAGTTFAGTVGLSDGSALSWGDGSVKIVGDSATDILTSFTAGAERMRIDAAGNVGIGTASPAFTGVNRVLALDGAGQAMIQLRVNGIDSAHWFANAAQVSFDTPANIFLAFGTNNTERMRIDTAGNVGIGRTPTQTLDVQSAAGGIVRVRGGAGANQGAAYYVTQGGADSALMAWGDAAAIAGGAANTTAMFFVGPFPLSMVINGSERMRIDTAGVITPGVDNAQSFGTGALRWSVIYAGTGTINTSDAREKTAVATMTASEIAAAKALAAEIGTFQFLDAIAQKGYGARLHAGMTVQRAIEIMTGHGLDPMRYGFICYDEWEASEASEDQPARPAGNRYGFRADELALFLARGFEARLAALESQP